MKTTFLYISLMLFAQASALQSCSESEIPTYPNGYDEVVDVPDNRTEIKTDTEKLELIKEQSKTIEITEGTGEYHISVLDKNIAEASLTDNVITVKGLTKGMTEIIISDQNGAYKNIKIDVYLSDKIVVDVENITINLPFGKPGSAAINILKGNDNYTVSCKDNSIANAQISSDNPNMIIIKGLEEGNTELEISDERGLKKTVHVTCKTSDEIFTDEEIESIKQDSKIRYMVGTSNTEDYCTKKKFYVNGKDDFNPVTLKSGRAYGIYELGMTTMLIACFDNKINYELGNKEGGKLSYQIKGQNYIDQKETIKFEVIQHKEGKVWVIFGAFDNQDELITGHMVFKE